MYIEYRVLFDQDGKLNPAPAFRTLNLAEAYAEATLNPTGPWIAHIWEVRSSFGEGQIMTRATPVGMVEA
jgi:hypothetical protein